MKYIGIALVVFVHLAAGLFLITQPGCQTTDSADAESPMIPTAMYGEDTAPIPVDPQSSSSEDLFEPIDPAFNTGAPRPVVVSRDSSISVPQRSAPTRPTSSTRPSDSGEVIGVLSNVPDPVTLPAESSDDEGISIVTSGPAWVDYTVVSGDSLWKISRSFEVSIQSIREASRLTSDTLRVGQVIQIPKDDNTVRVAAPPSELVSEAVPVEGSLGREYIVMPGDTLSRIAARNGTSVGAIRSANNLTSDVIRVGELLILPDNVESAPAIRERSAPAPARGVYHEVKSGENPTIIARRYGISVGQLMAWNNNFDPRLLKVGQRLQVGEISNAGAQEVTIEPRDQANFREVTSENQEVEVDLPQTPESNSVRQPQPASVSELNTAPAPTEADLEALLEDLENAPVVSPVRVEE